MAQGCRPLQCSKSAAIWGTPVDLRTSPPRQPVTRRGHCSIRPAAQPHLAFMAVIMGAMSL
jgi:hypothetical protein